MRMLLLVLLISIDAIFNFHVACLTSCLLYSLCSDQTCSTQSDNKGHYNLSLIPRPSRLEVMAFFDHMIQSADNANFRRRQINRPYVYQEVHGKSVPMVVLRIDLSVNHNIILSCMCSG